jgi:hypothetical protein
MRRAIVILTICVAACRDHTTIQLSDSVPAATGHDIATAVAETSPGPDSAQWQDASCEVSTTYAHRDPGELVREYVARNDSLGFFAGGGEANDDWLDGAEECPGHAGGVDGAAVVGSYRIDSLTVGGDSARYVVHYDLVGSTTPETEHMRFVPEARSVEDTIVLIQTPYGWRIAGAEVGDPFMSPAAVIRQANLDATSIRLLDSATTAGGQGSRPAPNDR